MKNIDTSPKIRLSKSKMHGAGRGIFATRLIKKGEVIERCPVVVLPRKDYFLVKKTLLRNYYFMWGKITSAICLGFGSMYNHSYEPNATYNKKIREQIVEFKSIKDIKKDEEITINYNYGNPNNKKPLWIKNMPSA